MQSLNLSPSDLCCVLTFRSISLGLFLHVDDMLVFNWLNIANLKFITDMGFATLTKAKTILHLTFHSSQKCKKSCLSELPGFGSYCSVDLIVFC